MEDNRSTLRMKKGSSNDCRSPCDSSLLEELRGRFRLVLVVDFDVVLLHSHVHSVLAVVVTNAVAVSLTGDQFATAGWNADLNVNALWTTAAAWVVARTWILHSDDLWLSTRRHFVTVLVLHVGVESDWSCFYKVTVLWNRHWSRFLSLNDAYDEQAEHCYQLCKILHFNSFLQLNVLCLNTDLTLSV